MSPFLPLAELLTTLPLQTIFQNMKQQDIKDQEQVPVENGAIDINADENMNGNQHLSEPVAEENEVEKLRAELEEMKDKYLRQAAEFDNFKRRNARERIEMIQTAGKEVITELLDVLDDSERAQKQLETTDDIQQVREGVQLVFSKLRNILAAKGLKAMETKGMEFNPDLHEAITEIEAGDKMKGRIVDEIQKGYYLNDKIIRFAKVVVGK